MHGLWRSFCVSGRLESAITVALRLSEKGQGSALDPLGPEAPDPRDF